MSETAEDSRSRKRFLLACASVLLFAFLVREWFVIATVVEHPIRGDIRQYVNYALNLLQHGTFSMAPAGSANVVADAFRGPGYPVFLAMAMLAGGLEGGWYPLALQLQVVAGTLTVLLAMAVGRVWLDRWLVLACGVQAALWPHHVAATGALLSEVLFGFLLMLGLWLVVRACQAGATGRWGWTVAAALACMAAWAVNPLALGLPLVSALLLWRRLGPARAGVLAGAVLLVAGGWAVRSAGLDVDGPGRAALNLVQGSWPQYHAAHNSHRQNPVSAQIMQAIDAEAALLSQAPAEGLARMAERMGDDPGYYLGWYLWRKPWLLWSWDIRIGAGDIYFHEVQGSPFETNAVLRGAKALFRWINPIVFAAALLGAVLLLRRGRGSADPASLLAVGWFAWLVLVHWVFQAEPRYAIPYRPLEVLLAMSAVGIASAQWARPGKSDRGRLSK